MEQAVSGRRTGIETQDSIPHEIPSLEDFSQSAVKPFTTILVSFMFALIPIAKWEPSPIDVLAPVVAVALSFNIGLAGYRSRISVPYLLLCYILVLSSTLTIPMSSTASADIFYVTITALVMLIGLAAGLSFQHPRLPSIGVTAMLLGFAVATTFSLVEYFVSPYGLRLVGLSKNPNSFGLLLVVPLVFVLNDLLVGTSLRLSKLPTPMLIYLAGGIIVSIVLTFSRNSLISSALSILILFLFTATRTSKRSLTPRLLVGILLITAASYGAYNLAPESGISYLTGKIEAVGTENSRAVHQREVFRAAISSSDLAFGRGPLAAAQEYGLGAHNAYITQLYDYGVVGLVALLSLIVGGLVHAYRAMKSHDASSQIHQIAKVSCTLVIVFAVSSLFMDLIHQRQFWIALGIAWAIPVSHNYKFVIQSRKVKHIPE